MNNLNITLMNYLNLINKLAQDIKTKSTDLLFSENYHHSLFYDRSKTNFQGYDFLKKQTFSPI